MMDYAGGRRVMSLSIRPDHDTPTSPRLTSQLSYLTVIN